METSLSELFGGADAPAETAQQTSTVETPAAVEAAPEPATTAEQQQLRDERGRFAKPAEPVAETPQAEPTPTEEARMVPLQSMLEERRKRQAAEAQYRAMSEMLQKQQAPQLTDEQVLSSPAETLNRIRAEMAGTTEQQIRNLKFELAEDLTRSLHADYDTVRDAFIAKVEAQDPFAVAIAQQMVNQANPAKFVYDQARRMEQMSRVGDESSYRARIEAEVRAKVLAELQRPAPAVEVPASLNSIPSAPVSSGSAEFEPTPLENIAKFHF
jgi:hypothetical protein